MVPRPIIFLGLILPSIYGFKLISNNIMSQKYASAILLLVLAIA